MKPPGFLPGQMVEVRPAGEIFATLDARGTLEGIPFMPEMLEFCGRQFRVWRRVERTCVEGDEMRRMKGVVYLDSLRCSGKFHDGCGKECRLFWHEGWLKPAGAASVIAARPAAEAEQFPFPTRQAGGRFVCQSTELLNATQPLLKVDLRQYYHEWRAKTYPGRTFLKKLLVPLWLRVQVLCRGMSVVQLAGKRRTTPKASLNLQPGEWVEVKSRKEIEETLDPEGRNRGLEFTRFMVSSCGKQFRVRRRIDRLIQETSGEMRQLGDTVILEDSTCDGCTRWGGCPRDAHHLWREIWLKRVTKNEPSTGK